MIIITIMMIMCGEEGGEKVWEGEYGANTMYTCM
jgi:hypothetical protein